MRAFRFARQIDEDGNAVEFTKAYEDAQLPEYQTSHSAGADFFCAEEVVVPSIWLEIFRMIGGQAVSLFEALKSCSNEKDTLKPTLIHTGVVAEMEDDEVLEMYNRSSNPKKLGLILANGVGVIDADYYHNKSNDGEILFSFYNIKPWNVTLKVGDRIGQGVFKKFLRPVDGLRVNDVVRTGGIGSTNTK